MEDIALSTIKEILLARGINSEQFQPIGIALDETKMYTFASVLIIFSTKARVTERELNNFLTFASENNHTSGILIVTPTKPSEMVLSVLRTHITDRANPLVQIFELRHLQFDISKHRKVPRHRIISDDERTKMMKVFNINSPKSLPKIDSQDPMAKWIGARPDDVLEVVGLCETSAENKRYRYCVADVTNG
jgi:DNA-directed RNA polymerases I, II, and III subunit RPABC1